MKSCNVVLVDDHKVFLEALSHMLEGVSGINVVASFTNGLDLIEMTQDFIPDVVLMDISMPGVNGIEVSRKILEKHDVNIILFSSFLSYSVVAESLSIGVKGYIHKSSSFKEVSEGIKSVFNGNVYLCKSIKNIFFNKNKQYRHGIADPTFFLTQREQEIFKLIAIGKNYKEVGASLGISPKTVEVHRKNIMDKLEVKTVQDLTRLGLMFGLISIF